MPNSKFSQFQRTGFQTTQKLVNKKVPDYINTGLVAINVKLSSSNYNAIVNLTGPDLL